jgi:hypothetical protein
LAGEIQVSTWKTNRFVAFALKSALKKVPLNAVVFGHECQPVINHGQDEFVCAILYQIPNEVEKGTWITLDGRKYWVTDRKYLEGKK